MLAFKGDILFLIIGRKPDKSESTIRECTAQSIRKDLRLIERKPDMSESLIRECTAQSVRKGLRLSKKTNGGTHEKNNSSIPVS